MNKANRRRRFALAALLATAAVGSAAPAQANPVDCETRLEQLEARFYEVADKRGYEAATEWWEKRWQTYYERCLAP